MAFKQTVWVVMIAAALLAGCTSGVIPQAYDVTQTPAQAPLSPETAQPAAPARQPGCTVRTRSGPNPTVESLLSPVAEADWTQGPPDSAVTILEYSDFQCEGCVGVAAVLEQIQAAYPQDVRIAFRHYPLSVHDKAALAAQGAEAAGRQEKFWEMHDLLFEGQSAWTALTPQQLQAWLVEKAGELGLDADRFEEDLNSQELSQLSRDAYEKNAAIGMPGTPFLVVNGEPYNGPLDFANLEATVSLILLEERQFMECPAMALDPDKQYFAILKTEKGDVTLELFAEKAPLAVNNFVFLARQDWFDGVTFHRVLPNFVAQAGDPTGTGFGGPGYAFDNEIVPDLTFDQPGLVAMANAGAGSNGSQFFITYAALPNLNGGYTIFGKVTSGMEVVESLTPRNPAENMSLPPGDKILDVEIQER